MADSPGSVDLRRSDATAEHLRNPSFPAPNQLVSSHLLALSPNRALTIPLILTIGHSPKTWSLNPGLLTTSHASFDLTADSSLFISNCEQTQSISDGSLSRKSSPSTHEPACGDSENKSSIHPGLGDTGNELALKNGLPVDGLHSVDHEIAPMIDHAPEMKTVLNNVSEENSVASSLESINRLLETPDKGHEAAPQTTSSETEGEKRGSKTGATNREKNGNLYTSAKATKVAKVSPNEFSNSHETRASPAPYKDTGSPSDHCSQELSRISAAGSALMPHTPSRINSKPTTSASAEGSSATFDDLEFNHSSVLNDTRNQFDLDISPDHYQIKPNRDTLQAEARSRQSPWRNFRAKSEYPLSSGPKPFLYNKNISQGSETPGISSGAKVDELTKQLTNCKIQLKLYEKFLQDLIDNKTIEVGNLSNFSALENLDSSEMKPLTASEGAKNLVEMSSLVEDLYCSLEDYQNKWRDSDQKASALAQTIARCVSQLSKVLDGLGIHTETLDDMSSPEEYFSRALDILRERMDHPVESAPFQTSRKNSFISNLSDTSVKFRPESSTMALFSETGHSDYGKSGAFDQPYEPEVRVLAEENAQLRQELEELKKNSIPDHSYKSPSSLEKNVEKKLEEYQAVIDRLQKEVNEFKSMSRSGSVSDIDESFKNLYLQGGLEKLQNEYDCLLLEYRKAQEKAEDEVKAIKHQLHMLNLNSEDLRSQLANAKHLQQEISAANKALKTEEAERIKLTYQVQSLQKDKETLQQKVDYLTEKLTKNVGENFRSKESIQAALNRVSLHFGDLFDYDVRQFGMLMKSFNKIADDTSLKELRIKLEQLQLYTGDQLLKKPNEHISKVKETHRSLSDYFARAVDVIVNDHIRLLLKESDNKLEQNYISELASRIKTLELENANLSKKSNFAASPRLKLRIEELTNRWKAEREARILDNRQAQERFRELDLEKTRR